mmetsp:Transcript_18131/g.28930  ORF Transcript_18131/g.28930 Transcript_18131/m.28930 type:complete len:228 (-) Transcript_18131:65-748(-)
MSWFWRVAICLSLASGYRRSEQELLHSNNTKNGQGLNAFFIDSKSRAHNTSKSDGLQYRRGSRDHSKLFEDKMDKTGGSNGHLNVTHTRVTQPDENMSGASTSAVENHENSAKRKRTKGLFVILLLSFAVVLLVILLSTFRTSRGEEWLETDTTDTPAALARDLVQETPRAIISRVAMHVTGDFVNFACPDNCKTGDLVEVPLPKGGTKLIKIPAGVKAGHMFSVRA